MGPVDGVGTPLYCDEIESKGPRTLDRKTVDRELLRHLACGTFDRVYAGIRVESDGQIQAMLENREPVGRQLRAEHVRKPARIADDRGRPHRAADLIVLTALEGRKMRRYRRRAEQPHGILDLRSQDAYPS